MRKEALEGTNVEDVEEEDEISTCPECDGTNLNEEGTICWNCSALEYE